LGVRLTAAAAFAAFAGLVNYGQERVAITPRAHPEPARSVRVNMRMDVRLVQIPVTVTDLRGSPVLGLAKTNFRVFEDDVERPVTALSVSDAPISAGVVFDTSRSMKPRLHDSRTALDEFLKTSGAADEFLLVRFSDRAELLTPFTRSPAEIARALNGVEAHGWTALVDAICLATQEVRKGRYERKVLVVLTDGNDNNSRYSAAELLSLLREADVRVYAISIIERSRYLQKICEETGGRAIWVRRMSDLPAAMDDLSKQIRSEYLVSYNPVELQNDGRYHRVRVVVQPPPGLTRVYPSWRHGYLAPNQ
jgi:Ca-activated chloride channel family protein